MEVKTIAPRGYFIPILTKKTFLIGRFKPKRTQSIRDSIIFTFFLTLGKKKTDKNGNKLINFKRL
jgi:hypothetical protein